ncbi:MAG TPA: hypothetical protein VNT42_04600 [Sphingomonas sp.]|nr:hypothetical protein [Sphingomonas sp.]
MTCPHCGAPADKTVSREGLIAHSDPVRINYRGRRLQLTRSQAEILQKLVRFGRASFEVLEGQAGRESLRSTVQALRRRLPPGVHIEALRGWGYALEIESGSQTSH